MSSIAESCLFELLSTLGPQQVEFFWRCVLHNIAIPLVLTKEDFLEVLPHLLTFLCLKVTLVVRDIDEWVADVWFHPELALKKCLEQGLLC